MVTDRQTDSNVTHFVVILKYLILLTISKFQCSRREVGNRARETSSPSENLYIIILTTYL